jgi:hypothetical protein
MVMQRKWYVPKCVSAKEAGQIKTDLKGWRSKFLLMSHSSLSAWPLAAYGERLGEEAVFIVLSLHACTSVE